MGEAPTFAFLFPGGGNQRYFFRPAIFDCNPALASTRHLLALTENIRV
jgi:hypothetical protein